MPVRPDLDVSFSDPDLPDRLEAMSPAMIDTLPFGVVLLDRRNGILMINQTERSHGALDDAAIGQGFFSVAAPRFNEMAFRGRLEEAQGAAADAQATPVSLSFAVQGSADADQEVQVRVHGATQGGLWLAFDRRSGEAA